MGSSTEAAAPVVPEDLTPEMVDDLVARMSDDEVRALLLDRLDAVAAARAEAPAPEQGLLSIAQDTVGAILASWLDVLRKVPNLFGNQVQSFANFADTFGSTGLLQLFGFTLLALAIGFAAEMAVGLWTRRWIRDTQAGATADLRGAVSFLFRRFCRELLGLVVFYYTLVLVGRYLLTPEQITYASPFVLYLIWLPRLGGAISRFILAPERPDLRMVNVSDKWATYLHRNQIGLFLLIGFTLFIVRFNALNGVPMGEMRLGFWLNTAIHLYIALIAWTAREGLSDMMRGTDPDRTNFDERVADLYPYFAIGVSAVMWLIVEIVAATGNRDLLSAVAGGAHFVTMFWLLMAPAIDTLIRGVVRHTQPPMIGTGPVAERAYKSTKRSFIRIGRVLAGIFVVLQIADVWDIDLRALAGTDQNESAAIVEFLIILAIGYIINEVVSLWINRRLAKEQTAGAEPDEEAGEGGGAGGSRLATVLPLLRVTAQVAIAVIFGLLALGALGLDITPLLAGAGIMGLAIGFGAQKLVSDIVGGIFFLIDDAFRVGEYVDVGGTTGTVEKISIRSMQLRHHRGPVHTIPYGEIAKLTNFSRDWVIMKLKFTVPFDTDPNKVKKIFKKIGAEMMEEPEHKDGFLQPFKSQGVFDFDDVGMIIRGKFMAKPGKQFTLRKEIYNRVKKAFAENGIDFARREVRVAIPGLEEAEHISEEQKAAIGAAAGEVVNQEIAKRE
ncbi:mechanosensitive ion channel family protein [Lutimaribacter marinistellae]|uniref:Mechanosensitive ion channel family protein n=1 Tax=Lutimaribacter marinistellae TaxID=1820329 RepID=A0ABV7TM69_9RHOB